MLSPHESALLEALRSMPSERQASMGQACAELLRLVNHHANCPGIGVDGFPCATPQSTCEQCREMVQLFDSLIQKPIPIQAGPGNL